MDSLVVDDLGSPFDDWGVSATYMPVSGSSLPIQTIFSYGDDLEDAQWRAALQASAKALVRESDVSDPSNGDVLTVDGESWTVASRKGPTGGLWELALRRDLRPTFRK